MAESEEELKSLLIRVKGESKKVGLKLKVQKTKIMASSPITSWEIACFRKGRGTRDQIPNIHWIMEKAREFQKNIYFCFIDYAKGFDCVDHNKL